MKGKVYLLGGDMEKKLIIIIFDMSLLDLKTHYHELKYIEEVFKLLPKSDSDYLKKEFEQKITNLGAIHPIDLAT